MSYESTFHEPVSTLSSGSLLQPALLQTPATVKVQALIHQVRSTSQLAGLGMAWFSGIQLNT